MVVDLATMAMSMEVVALDMAILDINVNGQGTRGSLRDLSISIVGTI